MWPAASSEPSCAQRQQGGTQSSFFFLLFLFLVWSGVNYGASQQHRGRSLNVFSWLGEIGDKLLGGEGEGELDNGKKLWLWEDHFSEIVRERLLQAETKEGKHSPCPLKMCDCAALSWTTMQCAIRQKGSATSMDGESDIPSWKMWLASFGCLRKKFPFLYFLDPESSRYPLLQMSGKPGHPWDAWGRRSTLADFNTTIASYSFFASCLRCRYWEKTQT